jgi:hypothetical protein
MKDLKLDSTGTLLIRANDLVIGESDNQNIADIIESEKGEFKRTPQIGVGSNNFINSPMDAENIKSIVTLNLQLDGFTVQDVEVEISGNDLVITPYAERL